MMAFRVLAAVAIAILAPTTQAGAQPQQASPIGLWRYVDDQTGKERGLVRILESNGALYGRIERMFDPADAGKACAKCEGDRRGKPVLGLDFLRGLRPDGDGGWSGGEILDPETGSTYRASVRLADGGRKLVVRGYMLVSLLGRSQTWVREQ